MAYTSKIHTDLYEFYSRNVPKIPGETPEAWKKRLLENPELVERHIKLAPMGEQIRLLAMRRALAMAGGQRSYEASKLDKDGKIERDDRVNAAVSKRFGDDTLKKGSKFESEQLKFLRDAFEYGTPKDGAIFWSAVDPDKLAKQVGIWNGDNKLLGALEATTDAKYINGAFNYAGGNTTEKYFSSVSELFGHSTSGHVTAVQMYGVLSHTVFCKTELPGVLKLMANQLTSGRGSQVKDFSIVVLDPVGLSNDYKCYTNNEIGQIPIVSKSVPDSVSRWIRGKQDCKVDGYLNSIIPIKVKAFWFERGAQKPSLAATKIIKDFPLIKR